MKTLPDHVAPYRRTAEFDETSVPAGLLGAHSTKAGVWGRIQVLEGRLLYHVLEGDEAGETVLEPGRPGVVEPGVRHRVEPLPEPGRRVRFFVEFLRGGGEEPRA